jgi:hypothetical protein
VFSWVWHQLVVWEDRTGFYKPSEMIQIMFEIEEKYHPLVIGFEENGLEEWARELIRGECHKRGVFLPVERLRAPRDKFAFIRALEPLGRAGEIVFARECPLLREQFLTFPRGRIDGPNALAYALQLRPGRLIYDGWNPLVHIAPITLGREPCYVAANATKTLVTGVVVQLVDGRVRILADFVADGDPGEAVEGVLRSAALAAGRNLTVIAGPQHFDQWTNVGLVQAARRSGVECRPGGSAETGRAFIRGELEKVRGVEGANIAVSIEARWTLRAFAGGYARPVQNGLTADEAAPGRYRVLMEGLEQLCGVFAWGQETAEQNVAYDHAGKPYLSIIPPRERVNA